MKPAFVDVAVLILFFNRPEPLAQVFEQVKKACPSRLFLYQDGPKGEQDIQGVEACREIVSQIDWECDVYQNYQKRNFGYDPSRYLSLKWAFSLADKCIVLEDDVLPSVSFFTFCKDLLDLYENDDRITMISGFNYEEISPRITSDYFFSSHFSFYGWASWKRVVDKWDAHYTFLDEPTTMYQLEGLIKERKFRTDFVPMCLRHRRSGKAYFESIFMSSMLLNSGLSIVPTHNLINNIDVTNDFTLFDGSIETMPKEYRRIFTMKRYELEFPLEHPKYIIENVAYKISVYQIMAWGHPLIKISRSFEELYLNLKSRNFTVIKTAIKNRIFKWLERSRLK